MSLPSGNTPIRTLISKPSILAAQRAVSSWFKEYGLSANVTSSRKLHLKSFEHLGKYGTLYLMDVIYLEFEKPSNLVYTF